MSTDKPVTERPAKQKNGSHMIQGAGPGRPKGGHNKVTVELKDMILKALDGAGGVEYLIARAKDQRTASAFLTLLGKVLPLQVTGPGGGPIQTLNAAEMTDDQLAAIAAGGSAKAAAAPPSA